MLPKQRVQEPHPNHPKTILEPPTRKSAQEAEDSEFEKIWSAYPTDRQRGRATCREHFRQAIADGCASHHILAAVQAYARETNGYTRLKVCFSDNWFKAQRWENHEAVPPKAKPDTAAYWAEQLDADAFIPPSAFGPALIREMLERDLTTSDKLKERGFVA